MQSKSFGKSRKEKPGALDRLIGSDSEEIEELEKQIV